MIWQLQTQLLLEMFHSGEQLFIVISYAKHAHYLLDEKVGKSSRWKYVVLINNQELWHIRSLTLLNTEDQWVLSAVAMMLLCSQHQKMKRKFWKFTGQRRGAFHVFFFKLSKFSLSLSMIDWLILMVYQPV